MLADKPALVYPETGLSPVTAPAVTAPVPVAASMVFSPTRSAINEVRELAQAGEIPMAQALVAVSDLNRGRYAAPVGGLATSVYTNSRLHEIGVQMTSLLFKTGRPTEADRKALAALEAEETKIRSEINSRFGLK